MVSVFESTLQEKLFRQVVSNLEGLGYRRDLLLQSYAFVDWFRPENPQREAPAAAFGRIPQSYDSACFAVVLANGKSGAELVSEYRALGAPLALEVRKDAVVLWKVGKTPDTTIEQRRIPPNAVDRVFKDHTDKWSAQGILRLKNISFQPSPRQLDFIDLGLIPALEQEISTKLNDLLSEVVAEAVKVHKKSTRQQPSEQQLFRLIFRFLAAKVLHDRGVPPFRNFSDFSDASEVLKEVEHYYGENTQQPILQDANTQAVVAANMWSLVDFRNLSVEVLAYIYEHTLVDKTVRKERSIHSTPHSIARYIVHRLPFEEIDENDRRVVEPFAGHGIFLVAALQRLRDLLPNDMNATERHRYFVKMLQGFELDAFALEVATLCLMLVDFPNSNGWQLYQEDVFNSQQFTAAIQKARFILSNPPFEPFSVAERSHYQARRSVSQPVEFLHRLLEHLPEQGMLGMVLPRQFIDGKSYREVRKLLVPRFQEIEVVALPDRVFRISRLESALLIAKSPHLNTRSTTTVSYTEVEDKDRKRFLTEYSYTRSEHQEKEIQEAEASFAVIALREIWERLSNFPRLGEIAEIHRGVEWQPPFDPEKYLSPTEKPGFRRGLSSAAGNLIAYKTPPSEYLCTKQEYQRGNAFDLPWDYSKIIVNAVRASRRRWRMVAFTDDSGLLCSQNFHAIWPEKSLWTTKSLAAVLNGPIACAFVAASEPAKHNRKQTLEKLPIPKLRVTEIEALDRSVDHYLRTVENLSQKEKGWFDEESVLLKTEEAKQVLLQIDALVLKGYNLPPRLERQLLDFFRGAKRPVPFPFTEYFPKSFTPTIPLWMYISSEYKKCTVDYFLKHIPKITDPILIEALQEVE